MRALIESFGTECCEVITSVRQASLLVLPPCKHTPANPELTRTQKQWHLVDAEQIAPNGMHNLCASETRLTEKKKKKTNYVSNFQLFKCTIQLENSLADRGVQFTCSQQLPKQPRENDTAEGNFEVR